MQDSVVLTYKSSPDLIIKVSYFLLAVTNPSWNLISLLDFLSEMFKRKWANTNEDFQREKEVRLSQKLSLMFV